MSASQLDVTGEAPKDNRDIIDWLLSKPENQQYQAATEILQDLIKTASQPRHVSGKSCIKLCHYVELCRKAKSELLRQVSYSKETSEQLFAFYIDWSDTNQHRSMRQVLEVLVALISNNPNTSISEAVKKSITLNLLSIISHQSSQPLVKPAFKAFDFFLTKKLLPLQLILASYKELGLDSKRHVTERDTISGTESLLEWNSLILDAFDWMHLPNTAPGAGKFLMSLFLELRDSNQTDPKHVEYAVYLWQQWILDGLRNQPESLDNIKNYILTPLFRADRAGSVALLRLLINDDNITSRGSNDDLDVYSSILLAALEIGKKSSLVEELDYMVQQDGQKKKREFVYLPGIAIGKLLSHSDSHVRSAAFSVLVASSSPLRPFPLLVLQILRTSLASLHADTDAKFRNETLSTTRHMIERLRGSTAHMTKEMDSLSEFLGYTSSGPRRRDMENVNARDIEVADETWTDIMRVLGGHKKFLQWYINLLLNELVSTASYQRHVTSLKCLQILLKSGIMPEYSDFGRQALSESSIMWPFTVELFNSTSLRLLLDLLLDPFEDVRSISQTILKYAPPSCFTGPTGADGKGSSLKLLTDFIVRANELASLTGRADLADGVARARELLYEFLPDTTLRENLIHELITDLKNRVSIAENNLGKAITESPVHSQFASLSLVWDGIHKNHLVPTDNSSSSVNLDTWTSFQKDIYDCFKRIWAAVRDVLCNDSPEGHLPQDLDDQEVVDTKDVLSYSFRAIHESSRLLGIMVSKGTIEVTDNTPFMSFDLFEALGMLTFEQLASLRHRGAFSTVALTFAKCCQVTQVFPQCFRDRKHGVLHSWYKGTITCIHEQASTTRRSAGIPSMITGLLSANAPSPSFNEVMEELKAIARKPAQLSNIDVTNLPQVHAMNCLKEVFKSSVLGRRSEPHIADGLQLAADSLQSDIWSIRNCGLLLLRSLIDCLFGTSESKSAMEAGWDGRSIRLSYDKYPSLPNLLLSLLRRDTEPTAKLFDNGVDAMESVFPALDIIRRAGPPERQSKEIYESVEMHLRSKVWYVRDIAARTVCTLILDANWMNGVAELFVKCDGSANYLHGALLVAKNILEKMLDLDPTLLLNGLAVLCQAVQSVALRPELKSADLQSAYHEVINTIMKTTLALSLDQALPQPSEGLKIIVKSMVPNKQIAKASFLLPSSETAENPHITLSGPASSALLRKSMILQSAYSAAMFGRPKDLEPLLLSVVMNDVDTACFLLEGLLEIWNVERIDEDELQELASVLLFSFKRSENPSVSALLLQNAADILVRLVEMEEELRPSLDRLVLELKGSLFGPQRSPELLNAKIRISGSVLRHEYDLASGDDEFSRQMHSWGTLLSACSTPDTDFDTRFAVVSALSAFYVSHKFDPTPYLISSLLVLYDTLTDDDDEIRDAGANIAASILETSLIPLTAKDQFARWLLSTYPDSDLLSSAILHKIVCVGQHMDYDVINGPLPPVSLQLAAAMKLDDSLFIEEEQNLFIDEVREANTWCRHLYTMTTKNWDAVKLSLTEWATEGLKEITRLSEAIDGPLGWTSKPQVFAICMTVVIVAATLEPPRRYPAGFEDEEDDPSELQKAINGLLRVAKEKQLHGLFVKKLTGEDYVQLQRRRR